MNAPTLIATLGAGRGASRYPLAQSLTADEQRYRALFTNGTLVERHVHTHEERWSRLYARDVAIAAVFVGPGRSRLAVACAQVETDNSDRARIDLWNLTALDDGPRTLATEAPLDVVSARMLELVASPDGAWIAATLGDAARVLLLSCDGGSHGQITLERRAFGSALAVLSLQRVAYVRDREIAIVENDLARTRATLDDDERCDVSALSTERLFVERMRGDGRTRSPSTR